MAARWEDRIGKGVLSNRVGPIVTETKTLCDQYYGPGFCKLTLQDEVIGAFETQIALLRQWCTRHKIKDGRYDGEPQQLGLFYFGPEGVVPAGHADEPPGVVVLMIFVNLTPLIGMCCMQASWPLDVGGVVTFVMDATLLRTTVQLVWTVGVYNLMPASRSGHHVQHTGSMQHTYTNSHIAATQSAQHAPCSIAAASNRSTTAQCAV
eukprot:4804134-Pyramimonas_sp.AAC.2